MSNNPVYRLACLELHLLEPISIASTLLELIQTRTVISHSLRDPENS